MEHEIIYNKIDENELKKKLGDSYKYLDIEELRTTTVRVYPHVKDEVIFGKIRKAIANSIDKVIIKRLKCTSEYEAYEAIKAGGKIKIQPLNPNIKAIVQNIHINQKLDVGTIFKFDVTTGDEQVFVRSASLKPLVDSKLSFKPFSDKIHICALDTNAKLSLKFEVREEPCRSFHPYLFKFGKNDKGDYYDITCYSAMEFDPRSFCNQIRSMPEHEDIQEYIPSFNDVKTKRPHVDKLQDTTDV